MTGLRFYPPRIIGDLWLIFGLYWFVSAMRLNRMRTREPLGQRLAYVLPLAAAMAVLTWGSLRISFLGSRFIARTPAVVDAGILLAAAGISLAIWSRYHIGRYWSGSVSLRDDHQLIRSGPYARIRHPIYTGILLGLLGSAVAMGTVRWLVAFGIVFASFVPKARREEALLRSEFGPAFEEHGRRTGFFLPRLF